MPPGTLLLSVGDGTPFPKGIPERYYTDMDKITHISFAYCISVGTSALTTDHVLYPGNVVTATSILLCAQNTSPFLECVNSCTRNNKHKTISSKLNITVIVVD